MSKLVFRASIVGALLALCPSAFARNILSIQGGYSLSRSSTIDGGLFGGASYEVRMGRSVGVGVFAAYQQLAPKGVFSSLTASSIPYGATLNLYMAPSFYIGANVGSQTIKVSNSASSLSGSENFVGGQAGLIFGRLGLEGRYLHSMSNGGVSLIQMMLQYRFIL